MERWQDKLRREAGEMDLGIRAALALTSDEAVRVELERLQALPHFGSFTWLWAPALAKRNRVMFRPFILSAFDRNSIDRSGKSIDAWKGETAAELEAWLAEVDAADDIELTKRLYTWRLETRPDRDAWWKADLLKRFRAAATPSARHAALAKVDPGSWPGIDAPTALELWKIDRAAARKFILSHLPWKAEIAGWKPLLDASAGDELHFELYRKIVDEKTWNRDVLALPASAEISAQLQQRHPAAYGIDFAPVFVALLERHGERAIAYVKRNAGAVQPRYVWRGKAEGKGLPELLALATEHGWIDLWATLLRTSASRELFDAEVKQLVKAGNRARLEIVPGRGREFHGQGFSFAQTHALTDATACALYAKYPALLRGAYRIHVTPGWGESFPDLARAAIAAGDADLVDYLASRLANQYVNTPGATGAIGAIVAHYEALPEAAFVTRAATALTRMPAMSIWSYDGLLKANPLARLLFERSTAMYLANSAAVRDLLESPQIHVQLLGFRVLGQADPRAREIAAEHVDLLQATLLRRLRAKSRRLAFAALRNAATHDEATARYLLGKMRDALGLPEKRYPMEQLVGLIGETLHRWPALRSAREQPVVFGA